MRCPKCNSDGVRYNQRRPTSGKEKKKFKRTDFTAKCNKCGWEGEC